MSLTATCVLIPYAPSKHVMPLPVLIVGGGIGGLTAALALVRRGIAVTVLEQATAFGEVGAGLTIGPNATRVLDALGLRNALERAAEAPGRGTILHYRTGATLIEVDRDGEFTDQGRAGLFQLHRADLVALLLNALRGSPLCELRTGAQVTGFQADAHEVTAMLSDGCAMRGIALIGADGLRSGIRASLLGSEAPRFTGQVAWRFLADGPAAEPFMSAGPSSVFIGPGGMFNRYRIRGGTRVNCIGIVRAEGWDEEGWLIPSSVAEFVARFADWHPDIAALARAAGDAALFKWALYDRDPLTQWSAGRVSLLGDAAHPMLPFLGLGAAMAIEDGWVLARCLAQGDVAEALSLYETKRIGRTTDVLLDSRRQGELYQQSNPAEYGKAGTRSELRLRYYGTDVVGSELSFEVHDQRQ